MKRFFARSIRTKLIALLTGTATATLLFACTILAAYQFFHYRNSLVTEETATAQLIADSSGPAVLFNDAKAAQETLLGLRADNRIEQACLFDGTGRLLAHFATQERLHCVSPQGPALQFTRRHLLLRRAIETGADKSGMLYMQISLQEMYYSLLHFAETMLLALFISVLFGGLLSSMLQRVISRPILHLTSVALQVSEEGNYLLRASRSSRDETGVLIDHFNSMMDRIHAREMELRAAQNNLEEKVRLRTEDLENEIVERKLVERDLEGARVAAENASHAKSAFLANMSHELRTPLNAIIGYSEMLLEDATADRNTSMVQDLNKVLDSAKHLLTLISDVLDISKIEAGKMKLDSTLRLAAEVLPEVIPTAEVLVKRNSNQLKVVELPCDRYVNVDPLRLRQCLLNLISNACKFTENGTVTLRMDQREVEGRDFMVWTVSDTGIGIPEEHINRLFKTFSQVDESNTRRFGGSGLGLAISQQLCQTMGGCISVESSAGLGSSFSIYIPVSTDVEVKTGDNTLLCAAVQ